MIKDFLMMPSDRLVQFMEMHGTSIISKDFMGYIIKVTDTELCAIDILGRMFFFSNNPDKPELPKRKLKKLLKRLWKEGFIKDASLDPFPEMESYSNIKLKTSSILLPIHMFGDPATAQSNMEYDDIPPVNVVDFEERI